MKLFKPNNSLVALLLLSMTVLGCKMFGPKHTSQIDPDVAPLTQNSNSTPSAKSYDTVLAEKIGDFTRTAAPVKINTCFAEGGPKFPAATFPAKCEFGAGANYRGTNGEETNVALERFNSPQDAQSALDHYLAQDGDYDPNLPAAEVSSDLVRYMIDQRIRTKNGNDLLLMKSYPRYEVIDRAYWVDGTDFYHFIDRGNGSHQSHPSYAIARAFVAQ